MDKDAIINKYDKGEFSDFLQNDSTGELLKILDEEGLEILKKSKRKTERIRYIISFSEYAKELFHNEKFIEVFLSGSISDYHGSLRELDSEAYELMIAKALGSGKDFDEISELFTYFNVNYQVDFIKNKRFFSDDMVYGVLKVSSSAEVISSIIENYDIDLLSHDINIPIFFDMAKRSILEERASRYTGGKEKKGIQIPSTMLDKRLYDFVWNKYDIFKVRSIIDDAEYCTDTFEFEKYVHVREDELINNGSFSLLETGNSLCDVFENMQKARETKGSHDDLYDLRRKVYELVRDNFDPILYSDIHAIYQDKGIEAVREHVEKCVNNIISNTIIDYHFGVNFYNVMIDLRELLSFYFDGNINIDEEHVYLYDKIANIDSLSLEEKIDFHNQLKQYNLKEMFYDDMFFARELMGQAIKDYSLNADELQRYEDEELSKKYGVPVYRMDGEPFFALSKSGDMRDGDLPVGHSFSLIGDKGFAIFGDPVRPTTFIYDSADLNPRQIIHVFPYDSFTYYHPFGASDRASDRVNMLLTPRELVEINKSYNELLILERGNNEFEFNSSIPKLRKMALYCLDEIRQQDVNAAKDSGVGIFLIDTSKYVNEDQKSYRPLNHDRFSYDYEYYADFHKEDFEKRR